MQFIKFRYKFSYEEEDTCMSYEEEDRCSSQRSDTSSHMRRRIHACHMRKRIDAVPKVPIQVLIILIILFIPAPLWRQQET